MATEKLDATKVAAGHLVLALAAERDRWRLRCEWQELRAKWFDCEACGCDDDVCTKAAEDADTAYAAYVAVGGTP